MKFTKDDEIFINGLQKMIDCCVERIKKDKEMLKKVKKGDCPNYIGKSQKEKPKKKRGRPRKS